VVALIGDEATVKRYYPENGRIRLEAANPDYGPIVVEPDVLGFRIAGKVVGLIRKI
jgi:repressor LexA